MPIIPCKTTCEGHVNFEETKEQEQCVQGKDGLITPRDLLRWAERKVTHKEELAIEGYMLLAERLRDDDEKSVVKKIIEE